MSFYASQSTHSLKTDWPIKNATDCSNLGRYFDVFCCLPTKIDLRLTIALILGFNS